MEKNLLKAIVISIAILLGWQMVVSYLYPPKPAEKTAVPVPAIPAPAPTPVDPAKPPPPVVASATAEPERSVTVETSHWTAVFSNRGGVPVSWILTQGPDHRPIHASDGSALELIPEIGVRTVGAPLRLIVPGDEAATGRFDTATWRVTGKTGDAQMGPIFDRVIVRDGEAYELEFQTPDPESGQIVTKRFVVTGGRFDLGLAVESSAGQRPFLVQVGPRIGDQTIRTEGTYTHTPPFAVVASDASNSTNVTGGEVPDATVRHMEGNVRWGGVTDNYFAMALATTADGTAYVANRKIKYNEAEEAPHDFLSVLVPVVAGAPAHLFVGPKDPTLLDEVSKRAAQVAGGPVDFGTLINYGFFSWLVRPIIPVLDWALNFTNHLTGNYGWSIVIVTTLFNLLFFPLRYKSSVAMKRAAKLQPRMKELQEKLKKYKATDPQFKELQSEQMALMREGNPLGGCLPMFVQFPFFWAFFVYFTTTFVVRQQPWMGWVQDLTLPDHYYILPVFMCAAQIGATLLMPMPQSDDPAMKMQRTLMTWVMPVFITYFFLVAAPSGLVLYWLTLNVVGIGMQYAINAMMPADLKQPVAAAPAKGSKKK